jgi:hypothetical protein
MSTNKVPFLMAFDSFTQNCVENKVNASDGLPSLKGQRNVCQEYQRMHVAISKIIHYFVYLEQSLMTVKE